MGHEEQETIETILKKISRAEGAFVATGRLGVVIITIVTGIAFYAFNKIEYNSIRITKSEKEIAIIQSREEDHKLWRRRIERVFSRSKYHCMGAGKRPEFGRGGIYPEPGDH